MTSPADIELAEGSTQIPAEAQLVRYLLGELAEAETTALDTALGDDAVWSAMQRAEDEVLESYAAGRLSAAQRDRLAERLAASPRLRDRLATLEGLHAIAARRLTPRRRATSIAVIGALAFAAAVILFVALPAREAPAPASVGEEVAALTLLPATRSADVPTVHIAGHPTLALSLVLDAEDSYPRYRVRLVHGGALLWSKGDAIAANGVVALRVPVRLLGDGAYAVELDGIDRDGALIKLGVRGFSLAR